MSRFSPVQAHKLKQPKIIVDGIEITEHKTDTSIEYTATDGKYMLRRVIMLGIDHQTTEVYETIGDTCTMKDLHDSKFCHLFKALYKYRYEQ